MPGEQRQHQKVLRELEPPCTSSVGVGHEAETDIRDNLGPAFV